MSKNQEGREIKGDAFCRKELRPLLVLLVAVLLVTLGWITYHEIKMKQDPVYAAEYHTRIHHPGVTDTTTNPLGQAKNAVIPLMAQGQTVAAAAAGGIPPIKLGDMVTHPNFGQDCTKCHEVTGPKSRSQIAGGKILLTANQPHPYWGPCTLCHTVVDSKGTPVAFTAIDPRSILGLELTEADATLTTKLDLPDKKGPIITKVLAGGLGGELGFEVGDMFYMVNNRKIETIPEFERALGAFEAGDVVRVTVWRQRREKIFRFSLPDVVAQVGLGAPNGQDLMKTPTAIAIAQIDPNAAVADAPLPATVIAVAAMGQDVNATISTDFGSSPYFIVVDLNKNNFKVIQNAGGTGKILVNDLLDMGVDAVVCGHIGRTPADSMIELGIKMYPGVTGDVKGAITAFKQGSLKEANGGVTPDTTPVGPGLSGRRRTL